MAFARLKPLGWMLLGAILAGLAMVLFNTVRYAIRGYDYPRPHAQGVTVTAVDDSFNTARRIEGKPRFQTTQFFRSLDRRASAGLWEVTGPAKFEWHYDSDETVLVLEGGALLTQNGRTNSIGPGDSVTFRAGEVVHWEVPDHLKKTWVLYDPGWLVRHLRALH